MKGLFLQIFALCLNVALCYVVNNPCHMTTDNVGALLASTVESVKTVVEVTKDLRRSVNETLSLCTGLVTAEPFRQMLYQWPMYNLTGLMNINEDPTPSTVTMVTEEGQMLTDHYDHLCTMKRYLDLATNQPGLCSESVAENLALDTDTLMCHILIASKSSGARVTCETTDDPCAASSGLTTQDKICTDQVIPRGFVFLKEFEIVLGKIETDLSQFLIQQ